MLLFHILLVKLSPSCLLYTEPVLKSSLFVNDTDARTDSYNFTNMYDLFSFQDYGTHRRNSVRRHCINLATESDR